MKRILVMSAATLSLALADADAWFGQDDGPRGLLPERKSDEFETSPANQLATLRRGGNPVMLVCTGTRVWPAAGSVSMVALRGDRFELRGDRFELRGDRFGRQATMAIGPHGILEGLDELPADRRPVVFMFQPNAFEPVTPDRLAEWERSLVDYYGLPTATVDSPEAVFSGRSWSNCGDGRICADDSDDFDYEYVAPSGPDDATSARRPAVFMWQPSRFFLVPAERLADWERVLREHVGIPASAVADRDNGTESLSATLPNDCMDDCDYASE